MTTHTEAVAFIEQTIEQLRRETVTDGTDHLPPVALTHDLDAVVARAFAQSEDGSLTLRDWVNPRRLAGLVDQH